MMTKKNQKNNHILLLDVKFLIASLTVFSVEESINYMINTDKCKEEIVLQKISNFDQDTANNYRVMFERAIRKAERASLQQGRQQGIQ